MARVSIILPVRNTADLIGAAVASLRAQTCPAFEALVIDDGSEDDSLAQAQAAAGGDGRFRFVRQDHAGLSVARNRGLALARAPVIGFLDSDDTFAPQFLERMLDALAQSQEAWVSCAIDLIEGDSTRTVCGVHGGAHPLGPGPWARLALTDWPQTLAHWPSAWNKLYRRGLIGDLRFVPGLRYEDHPWFQALAARTGSIAHVPEPLYRYRKGRAGQITGADDERVFDQFAILDHCADIIAAGDKPGARAGMQGLATRLLLERAAPLRDPGRRARLAQAGGAWLAARGLRYAPQGALAPRNFALMLRGELPLSVVMPVAGGGPALTRSLTALAAQGLRDFELLLVPVGAAGRDALSGALSDPRFRRLQGAVQTTAEAWQIGCDAARGVHLLPAMPGMEPEPGALWLWVEGMVRAQAALGLSLRRGPGGAVLAPAQDGADPWGAPLPRPLPQTRAARCASLDAPARPVDPARLALLRPDPGGFLLRRDLARAGLAHGGPLGPWAMLLGAARDPRGVICLGWPGVRLAPDGPPETAPETAPETLIAEVRRLAPLLAPLPQAAWLARLVGRALMPGFCAAGPAGGAERRAWLAACRPALATVPPGPCDPDTPPLLAQALAGAPPPQEAPQ